MKKIYVLAALIVPFVAQAGEWDYDVEGSLQGAYGYSEAKKHNHQMAKMNLESYVEYAGDAGYVSLHLDLMGGIDKELKDYNQGNWGEEFYAVAENDYGQIMLGQINNVAYLFSDGAPSTGILNSNSAVVDFLHNPNWKRNKKETKFATLNTTDINTDGVAPKINYVSPEFWGTAVGFSYMPDSYNRRGLENKKADYAHDDAFVGAVYSDKRIGNINTKTAFGYAQYHENDKEFSVNVNLNYGNWTLCGGFRKTYIDGEDKLKTKENLPEDFDGYREGYAWNVGIGYEIGPFSTSLSYFDSKQKEKNNQNKVLVWSNQFEFNKYLEMYLAAAKLDYKNENIKDDGYAGVVGIGVKF